AIAQATADPHGEALALHRMALARGCQGRIEEARSLLDRGITLTHTLGLPKPEAQQLWTRALCHAELGDRPAAVADARAAVDCLRWVADPEAAWSDKPLNKSLGGGATPPASAADNPWGVVMVTATHATAPPPAATGTGPLRMALSAGKAMAAFVASGL